MLRRISLKLWLNLELSQYKNDSIDKNNLFVFDYRAFSLSLQVSEKARLFQNIQISVVKSAVLNSYFDSSSLASTDTFKCQFSVGWAKMVQFLHKRSISYSRFFFNYLHIINDIMIIRQKLAYEYQLDCPLSEEKQAAHPKFKRPNGKNTRSKFFLKSVKNWCAQLTCKLKKAISLKIWIKSKQIKTNENQRHFWLFSSKA